MNFEVWKKENCFADSQTYEYRLPIENREFLPHLVSFSVKISEKLRRPAFFAIDLRGIQVKGILIDRIIIVSFPDANWEVLKMEFEQFITSLDQEASNESCL